VGQFKISAYALSVCLAISVSFPCNARAQSQGAQVRAEIKHDISPALRTLTSHHFAGRVPASGKEEDAENRHTLSQLHKPFSATRIAEPTRDLAAQTTASGGQVLVPGLNFDGVSAAGRAVPDTNGAVGLTQYFQWVNVDFQIFDKNTGASIYGPADAATLWTGLSPCNTTDDSDVVVEIKRRMRHWSAARV